MTALVIQWVRFTGLWTPAWYSQYRSYLSILVGTCIISPLAETSYYDPVAGHDFLSHDLELTRDMLKGEKQGFVDGPMRALEGDQAANAYVRLKKRDLTKEAEKRVEKQKQADVKQDVEAIKKSQSTAKRYRSICVSVHL